MAKIKKFDEYFEEINEKRKYKKRKRKKKSKPYSNTHGGLDKWFDEGWKDISKTNPDGSHPPCGRSDASKGGYPKCRKVRVAAKMSKKEKKASVARKRSAEKRGRKGSGRKPNYSK